MIFFRLRGIICFCERLWQQLMRLFIIKKFLQGRCPCDPAKGVPPFETLLRALRGRDSAVKGKNDFKSRSSRD